MRAIAFTEFGGPEVLQVVELSAPHAGPGQVRIKVVASDVNPSDTVSRSGFVTERHPELFPVAPLYIYGWNAAGVIDEVGPAVHRGFSVGDRVLALVTPKRAEGAQAEYVVAQQESVVHLPDHIDFVSGATLLMNAATAQSGLEQLDLPAGATLAVTGSIGAVGGYVIELAKEAGLTVIADASPADVRTVREFGADHILARGTSYIEQVRQLAPDGVDAVFDTALQYDTAEAIVRDGGSVAVVRPHQRPNRRIRWIAANVHNKVGDTPTLERLRDLAAAGKLTLRVARTFFPEQAAQAHQLIENGGVRGRPVIVF
ncbi:NADP-dependent oxidoreductase [Mycobacteroides chelonae]|uniref:Enoyl reductase (ER) domain-containing protein n=1 Tax=Mycobacteroides chelonae TaxID=1774 RepID=A0A1S1M6C2_MYCCH|nr:NADP-dependent oxidoreductase [Mycobacteroides chelonae]OHU78826.1 hypothetical protein BKG84_10885 [Mycobacteroides chelonae]QQG85974.1 NADP-dependent oxidoreductase [Mycobacteroides chelonae]QQG90791.1 NADP-dependent oxidoreductase [Mycobacteroides chelonae]